MNMNHHLAYEFIKYVLASGLSLVVDYSIYILLEKLYKFSIPTSAVFGYLTGLMLAYFLVSKFVFQGTRLQAKRNEFILFLASGLFGVILTFCTASLVSLFSENIHIPKLTSVVISFLGVYIFRKFIVFRTP